MQRIRVGSRGSRLARIQTQAVISQLSDLAPDTSFELVIIQSTGDLMLDRALPECGVGAFTQALERSLLDREIDLAVHSMKDMPLRQPPGLAVAPPPRRADCRDALVLRRGLDMGEAMQRPIRIGTGSPRRIALLSKLYPSVEAVPIRGNIDTRLRKSQEELDGAVLAAAGLLRAGMEEWITAYLDPASFVPAPAQGILGLEYREENQWLGTLLAKLSHEPSDFAARAERAFLKAAGGNCHMPVGAWCRPGRGGFLLTGLYGVPGSSKTVQGEMAGGNPERLGRALAQRLMEEYEADGRE